MNKENLKLNLIFPNREIGTDVVKIRDYTQAAEELGYNAILIYDHVILGVIPSGNNKYTVKQPFHDPFILIGLLSGLTKKINFMPAVLVLPQRQTALVAKQAAMADLYSGGRLQLGVGVGADESVLEYPAMGYSLRKRGERLDHQIDLLRSLWTKETVTDQLDGEQYLDVGINPRPKKSIPIWIGGFSDAALRRAAKLGDGWLPMGQPERSAPLIGKLNQYLIENGRDVKSYPIMGGFLKEGRPSDESFGFEAKKEKWIQTFLEWEKLKVNNVSLGSQGYGFKTIDQHIQFLEKIHNLFKDRYSYNGEVD